MRFRLEKVYYMPNELEPNVLYVSEEFGAAAHLCACGCGSKVNTPLGPTEWSLKVTPEGASLYPSIGNWQLKCQSHYWIREGEVKWSNKWTPEQIAKGRKMEETRRQKYFSTLQGSSSKGLGLWSVIKSLFKK